MILFFAPGGRLGNLMFQLSYLQSIKKPRERVLCTGLNGAKRSLAGLDRFYGLEGALVPLVLKWGLWLVIKVGFLDSRLFGQIEEREDGQIIVRRGWLPVRVVGGFFQFPQGPTPEGRKILQPRAVYRERAKQVYQTATRSRTLFLHIRRTDYTFFRLENGRHLDLPLSYYQEALQQFGDLGQFHVFVVGDDQTWAREHFSWLPNKTFSSLGPLEDLALMALCGGGVVSNSSFAWWGGRTCRRSEPIIGPRYWIGWNMGYWRPPGVQHERFVFLPVKDEGALW